LKQSGLIDDTLVIVTGEFGRTPKINKNAGRDHWAPVSTMMFAGGGVKGGNVIGASDNMAAYPITERYTPADIAATLFDALAIPRNATWLDTDDRPHELYHGEPITALF